MRRTGIIVTIPLFQKIHSLSVGELRKACKAAYTTAVNLEKPSPVIRRYQELVLPDGMHVQHFVLLRGGRHAIIATIDRQVQLWDLGPDKSEGCHARLPKLLASHESQINPQTVDYNIQQSPSKEVVVAGIVESG